MRRQKSDELIGEHWRARFQIPREFPADYPDVSVARARGARTVLSWSCGKDTCYALHLAKKRGFKVEALFTLVNAAEGLVGFHCVKTVVAELQAEALGLPLWTFDSTGDFASKLQSAVADTRRRGMEVFGMGYFEPTEQRYLVHTMAERLGFKVFEPLCRQPRRKTLKAMSDAGLKILITSVDRSRMDASWLGKQVDAEFIAYLDRSGKIDHCGEAGEFHTVVLDAPEFKARVDVTRERRIEAGEYAHLLIESARLRPKR